MTNKEREKWLHLYEMAQKIGMMQPWDDFSEADKFTYIWEDHSKTVLFPLYVKLRKNAVSLAISVKMIIFAQESASPKGIPSMSRYLCCKMP